MVLWVVASVAASGPIQVSPPPGISSHCSCSRMLRPPALWHQALRFQGQGRACRPRVEREGKTKSLYYSLGRQSVEPNSSSKRRKVESGHSHLRLPLGIKLAFRGSIWCCRAFRVHEMRPFLVPNAVYFPGIPKTRSQSSKCP